MLSLLLPLLLIIAALVLQAGTMRALARRRRQACQAVAGRAHAAGLGGRRLGLLGHPRLVRRSDSAVGRLSELAMLRRTREPGSSPMNTSSAGSRWPSGFCAGSSCRPRSFLTRWPRHSGVGGLPLRRVLRLLWNWRWWPAVVLAALIGVALPGRFFTGEPHGTVAHQVWDVFLKLAGAYLLAIVSWVLLLAWAAVLFARTQRGAKPPDDSLVPAPVHSGPLGEDSVRLPLPESSDDSGGKA